MSIKSYNKASLLPWTAHTKNEINWSEVRRIESEIEKALSNKGFSSRFSIAG